MSYLNNIDSLVNFKKDILEPLVRGKSLDELTWPEGYREIYERWEAVQGEAVIKMNPDDRLLSFTDFIREENRRMAEKMVKRTLNPKSKKLLAQYVARGQYLRVQDKNGEFTKIITRSEIDQKDSLTVRALSDTCVSSTTDWGKVCDEQSALIFAEKLREQHFLVQRLEAGRQFKAEVVHPKSGTYTVTVDLDQALNQMLVFSFVNAEGKKKEVSLNQFGDAYSIIEESFSSLKSIIEAGSAKVQNHLMLNSSNQEIAKQAAMAAAGAAMAAQAVKSAKAGAQLDQGMPHTPLMDGRVVPNVQAAKANVEARMAQQDQYNKESMEGASEAEMRYRESLKPAKEAKEAHQNIVRQRMQNDSKRQGTMIKAAAGTIMGSGAFGAFLTWIVT